MIVYTIVEPEGCVNGNVAVVIAGRPACNPSGWPTRRARAEETVDSHSSAGMLPSAMPSASLSSRFAHRYNPSYRWQSAFMSAPVDISINCLNVPRWSASDTSSAPSPPPWARTCVTWVSMVTASRRPRPYGGVQPGPWLSGESAEKPVGAPLPHGRGPARLRTIRLIVILALAALFVPLAACHEWSSRVPSRAPVYQVTEDSS